MRVLKAKLVFWHVKWVLWASESKAMGKNDKESRTIIIVLTLSTMPLSRWLGGKDEEADDVNRETHFFKNILRQIVLLKYCTTISHHIKLVCPIHTRRGNSSKRRIPILKSSMQQIYSKCLQ